jgi:hypothetical protein
MASRPSPSPSAPPPPAPDANPTRDRPSVPQLDDSSSRHPGNRYKTAGSTHGPPRNAHLGGPNATRMSPITPVSPPEPPSGADWRGRWPAAPMCRQRPVTPSAVAKGCSARGPESAMRRAGRGQATITAASTTVNELASSHRARPSRRAMRMGAARGQAKPRRWQGAAEVDERVRWVMRWAGGP